MIPYSTADRVASFLEITTPTGVQLTAMNALINAITNFIKNYTSRTFEYTVYNALTVDTERGQVINLPYYPIDLTQPFIVEKRSSQLNEDKWQIIDGLYYEVDTDAGIIEFMDGVYVFRGRGIYRVTFTAGYNFNNTSTFLGDTEAGDVELALWLIARDIWLKKKIPADLYQERLGDYSTTYKSPLTMKIMTGFTNSDAQTILDKYQDVTPVSVLTPLQSITK